MTFRECLAVALIGLYVIIFSPRSMAADLTPSQARDILAVAYGQYHGPRELFEDGPPPIHITSQATLREKFHCAERCPGIHGLYSEESGEIFLDDQLDFSTLYATTVLLHEYIHYFQVRTKGRLMDLHLPDKQACLEIVAREQEAYRIQSEVLLKAGDYMRSQSVRMVAGTLRC